MPVYYYLMWVIEILLYQGWIVVGAGRTITFAAAAAHQQFCGWSSHRFDATLYRCESFCAVDLLLFFASSVSSSWLIHLSEWSALTLLVQQQDGRLPCKQSCVSNPVRFSLEDMWGSNLSQDRPIKQRPEVVIFIVISYYCMHIR